MNLNKNTKIWLNYAIGLIISVVLLWGIYLQIKKQLIKVDAQAFFQTGPAVYLLVAILLMPLNLGLEAKKWHLLAKSAQTLSFRDALKSYFAGIATSLVTPNRIGEYPGRLLYLRQKNTFRLISISILGVVSQLLTLFIFGTLGLVYYNIVYPGAVQISVLAGCLASVICIGTVYWRFEKWSPIVERIRVLRKYQVYGNLLKRFKSRDQWIILNISLLRYAVYTAQYLILLHWMKIDIPVVEGFLMCALFFWIIAVIPSISFAELGARGQVSLYLFHHFSENTIGILGATVSVWCINLILPAVAGSILLLRTRIIR